MFIFIFIYFYGMEFSIIIIIFIDTTTINIIIISNNNNRFLQYDYTKTFLWLAYVSNFKNHATLGCVFIDINKYINTGQKSSWLLHTN